MVGAHVSLRLSYKAPQSIRRPFRAQWGGQTDSGGAFRFTGLPDGTYRICVQAPQTVWLDACKLGLSVPSVVLTKATREQTIRISMVKGAEISIRIDDPGMHLLQNEGKRPGAHLLVGAWSPVNTFREAIRVSQDASSKSLKVVIPFNRQSRMAIASSFFKLADSNGTPLSQSGIAVPVTVLAGQTPPTIRFSVTGVK